MKKKLSIIVDSDFPSRFGWVLFGFFIARMENKGITVLSFCITCYDVESI